MSTAGVVAACIFALIYLELAVGIGYYMFLLASKKMPDADEGQRKLLKKYSVIAGVAFPITLAIIFANRAAERR